MATPGRTGPPRLILGSVADRMVREGATPLLLIPPSGPAGEAMRTALLPLDGSELGAEALQMLSLLADRPLERVRLLRVVEAEDQRHEATEYLKGVAKQLSPLELDVEVRVRADPAYAVEDAGRDVDVVIMSTHGEGGRNPLRHGRVAEHVARNLGVPIIFVRPGLSSGESITRFLSNVSVFRGVDRELLTRVANFAHQRSYPKGEEIVRQGQIGVGFFVLRSGRVEVVQERDGRREQLRTLGPGEVFGEIALVERTMRTATVRALEPTTCVALTGWTLRTLLEDSPEAMKQVQSLAQERLGEQGVR
jgi:nucleotide-binding universal stress UspA family protein